MHALFPIARTLDARAAVFVRTVALLAALGLPGPAAHAGNPNLLFTQLPDSFDTPTATPYTVLADLNGDGRPDLIRTVPGGSVGVQLGLGSGSFAAGTHFPAGAHPGPFVVADLNNDGKLDVVVANLGMTDNGSLSVLLGNADGTLQSQIVINLGIVVRRLVVTDYNKDGKADLVAIGYPFGSLPLETLSLTLTGNGDGTFGTPTTYANSARTAFPDTRDVVVGDFNGDTWPDFVVSNPVGYAIAVFFNNQDGTFTRRAREMQILGNVASLATTDFNGDGMLDLAIITASDTTYGNTGAGNNVAVVDGNGDGTFGTLRTDIGALDIVSGARNYSAGPAGDTYVRPSTRLLSHDMDGDGQFDLLLLAEPSQGLYNILSILRGAGNGTFSPGAQLVTSYGSAWCSVADLNNDTAVDVVVTPNSATAQTYLGIPPGSGTLLVTTALDEDNGTVDPNVGTGTSLREAWNQALTQVTPQTITFAANLAGQTILLTNIGSTISGPSALRLPAGRNVTVQGLPGNAGITIDGGGNMRPFFVDLDFGGSGSGTLTLNDLTIQNGRSTFGGGIFNLGTLTMRRCTLRGNSVSNQGGAIYTGAGYATGARALLVNCTIANNSGLNPGIMSDSARLELLNVTIRGNHSPGGIPTGGGIRIASGSTVTLTNTIVAGNSPSDIDGGNAQADSRHNLIGTGGAGGLVHGVNGNLVGVADVGLASLGNYGGPTPTMSLLLDSPARNAGIADPAAPTDQRGIARPQEAAPDIGAFELQPAPPQFLSDSGTTFIMGTSHTFTLVASGSPPPVFTTASPLPAGVSLSASGVLSGNPSTTAGGVHSLTIVASNGVAPVATQTFTLTVVEAPSLVVSTTDDEVSSYDGVTSLREALATAATLSGAQTVTFAPALTAGGPATITLASSQLVIASFVTISGPGASLLTVSGNHARRVFHVAPGGAGTMTGLTIADGFVDNAAHPEGNGAGVLNEGALTVSDCVFTGHVSGGSARGDGAGLFHRGSSLLVQRCTFTGNQANGGGYGAAIGLESGTGAILASTFYNNHAQGNAGGIVNYGTALGVTNCTFTGNTGENGAAIIHYGNVLALAHCTIVGNTASYSGGGIERVGRTGNDFQLLNNLIAQNSAPLGPDAFSYTDANDGVFTSLGHNLVGNGAGALGLGAAGDLLGSTAFPLNPRVGPLANNGGPTATHALLDGSPAINSGATVGGLTTDQRGHPRVVAGQPDIGAVENETGDDDPDRDTLSNVEEAFAGTNPLSIDTDGDGFNDATEILNGTDPTNPASVPATTRVERVLGYGPARGLDLSGNLLYAFNVGTPGAAGQAGDANFTADNVAGVTVSAPHQIPLWTPRDFGPSSGDATLTTVFQSIRWADHPNVVTVTLGNLSPGHHYKLQLLLAENGDYNRRFDVLVDGVLLANDLQVSAAQGIPQKSYAAAAMVHEFTASGTSAQIVLSGLDVADPSADRNPILSGVTLEALPTAPGFTNPNSALFVAGTGGAFSFTASGDPAPTFNTTDPLPEGVTLNSAGLLSGIPASGSVGVYQLTITAGNGVSPDATQAFTLTVWETPSLFVTTSADVVDPLDNLTSLREANDYANSLGGVRTITIASGVNGTLNLPSAGDPFTLSHVITGAGGIALLQGGEWILGAANSYTGPTTISAGTLTLGAGGAVPESSSIQVASGATFDVSAVPGGFPLGTAQTLRGTGSVVGSVRVDGTIAPGASPGTLSTGAQTWNGGGAYEVEMNDAAGTEGVDPGWDLLNITGDLTIDATSSSQFTINVVGLTGLADFNPATPYAWKLVATSGEISGFAADKFALDVTGFGNPNGTFALNVDQAEKGLFLFYTPACEGNTIVLDPNWHVVPDTGNLNASATFANASGLTRIHVTTAVNCTVTAQAFSVTDVLLGTITPLIPSAMVDLPAGTTKVILTAVREAGQTARVNAGAKDACDNYLTSDPVIATLEVLADGQVFRRLEGIPAAEHYLHVVNGDPGLTALDLNLNGRLFRLESPPIGQPVISDLRAAMLEGDDNVLEITGWGEVGSSALILLADFGGDSLVELPESVRLSLVRGPEGLRVTWPETLPGWTLQASPTPAGDWTAVADAPMAEGGRWQVAVDPAGGPQFYRLQGPVTAARPGSVNRAELIPQNHPVNPQPRTPTYDAFVW